MTRIPIYICISFLCLLFAAACNNTPVPSNQANKPPSVTKEQLMEMNKAMIAEENDQIDALLLRYKWPVNATETGVRYWIYQEGEGAQIKQGDILQCEYSLKLITGDEIYNSDNDGLLRVHIGKSEIPSGLEETILLMRQGDKAKIIVPSYRAYGIAGDGDRVPSRSTLIYDIHIIKNDF